MRVVCLLLACLAGCTESPPPTLDPPPVPPVLPGPLRPAPDEIAVVHSFDRAAQREPAVVLSPAATADKVEAIRQADRRARAALSTLGKQRHAIKPASLAKAKTAVNQLEDALRQP